MLCKHSENCAYYRTYRFKNNSRQHQFLTENYCEGKLSQTCRRLQYEAEYSKEPPEDLAPNGYLVGTHKKMRIENTRQFERYEIKNGACMLQVLDTKKTFSAWIVDVSEGGVRLELNIHPEELDISPKKSLLRILGYSVEAIPIPLTKEVIKPVWQNNQTVGCSFADPLHP